MSADVHRCQWRLLLTWLLDHLRACVVSGCLTKFRLRDQEGDVQHHQVHSEDCTANSYLPSCLGSRERVNNNEKPSCDDCEINNRSCSERADEVRHVAPET